MLIAPILNNITLLVTLSVAYVLMIRSFDQKSKRVQLLNGILFGLFIILGMYNSVELSPGLIFDGRSIVLSVAGLFGGPITALVAFLMAMAYRLWIGGAGVLMGVLVIIESALVGVVFHYLAKQYKNSSLRWLYLLMGLIVHFIMLLLVIALPTHTRTETFISIAFPVLVIYPLASFLVCILFYSQEKYLKTVQNLAESEGRFRQLFMDSQMICLVIDPDTGAILNANKAAENFYGYSGEEFRSINISNINTLPKKEIEEKIKLSFAKTENRFCFTHRLSSGELREVEVFAGPVDYGGKTYLYSIITDATQRNKAEKQLRESELSYRGLFDAVKDAIYIQNRQGEFLDVNAGAEKMYGYDRKDFIGKTPVFLSAPGKNDLEQLYRDLERAFNGKETEFEFWGRKRDGREFPKYVRLFQGKYFGEEVVIAIGHDITHRKQAQKELEESRFNLHTLMDVSEDVILLLDSNGVIVTHNKAFTQYHKAKGEYQGEFLFNIFPPEIANDRVKYFENVVQTRKPISFEDYTLGKDWWVSYYPIPDNNGRVDRVAVYARDISAQKKMLNLQRNLQVAENSARLKQQFLSNMSHEMRTPMNGIIGMANLLSKSELTDEQKDYLDTIQESSNTLLLLINDVLDLARFESGKMKANLVHINIKELEKKILNLFRQSAVSKGLEFNIVFGPSVPEVIVSDEKRLLQVMINLLGNALKFTSQGSINVKGDMITQKANKKLLKISVEDTGIGIDQDFAESIFDEFAQLDNSKTRKYEGSGLGLAISKKIVELLGGEIGVKSQKGQGSIFWFTINTAEAERIEALPKEVADYELKPLGLSVLMVEDKIINRKVASLILKNMGCTVDIAENGLEGVDRALKNHYDVVLMDIQMPVMDGVTAMQTIRKSNRKQPWIIGLSAEAMEGDAEKYISLGMDDYITKPLVPKLLYEKLLKAKKN